MNHYKEYNWHAFFYCILTPNHAHMHILSDMLKPFAGLLSKDPVSKKDFVKIAHEKAPPHQKKLLDLLQMLQFTQAHREG